MTNLFEQVEFFSGLDRKALDRIAEAAIPRRFEAGEVLVRQGEMGLGMYVIVSGSVRVEREDEGRRVRLATIGAGETVAEMSVIDSKPRSATVTAEEDTNCLLLTRDSVVTLMNRYPEIPIRVASVLAERLRAADERRTSTEALAREDVPSSTDASARLDAPSVGGGAATTASSAAGSSRPTGKPSGAKAKTQDALLEIFKDLYAMRVFSRFSVALLGCPVEGSSPDLVTCLRVGDVKALVVPADRAVVIDVNATQEGNFTVHVLTPGTPDPKRFAPRAIRPGQPWRVTIDPPTARLARCANGAPS